MILFWPDAGSVCFEIFVRGVGSVAATFCWVARCSDSASGRGTMRTLPFYCDRTARPISIIRGFLVGDLRVHLVLGDYMARTKTAASASQKRRFCEHATRLRKNARCDFCRFLTQGAAPIGAGPCRIWKRSDENWGQDKQNRVWGLSCGRSAGSLTTISV